MDENTHNPTTGDFVTASPDILMIRYLIVIFILICCQHGLSQNLVQNGSFEEFTDCPLGGFKKAKESLGIPDWFGLAFGTPDYYNSCAGSSAPFGVPNNWRGYQSAYHGDAYLGLGVYQRWHKPNERAISNLKTELKKNKLYCFGFKAVMATESYGGIATNNLHGTLTNAAMDKNHNLYNRSKNIILKDSLNWQSLNTFFIADGYEQTLILGGNENRDSVMVNRRDCRHCRDSYYFFDAVYLLEISPELLSKINKNDTFYLSNAPVQFNPNAFEMQVSEDTYPTILIRELINWFLANPFLTAKIHYSDNKHKSVTDIIAVLSENISPERIFLIPDSNMDSNNLNITISSMFDLEEWNNFYNANKAELKRLKYIN